MIIVPVDCSRWVRRVSCRVAGMKQILLMIAVGALVGCGKKEHPQASAGNTEATKPERERGTEATKVASEGWKG